MLTQLITCYSKACQFTKLARFFTLLYNIAISQLMEDKHKILCSNHSVYINIRIINNCKMYALWMTYMYPS